MLSAYASVHSEVDSLITQAKSRAKENNALIQGKSQAITAPDASLPLSRREIAGIAGQILLDIRNAAADQKLMSPEFTKCVAALAMKAKTQGISAVSVADFAVLAAPTLYQLQITPSSADLAAIGQSLLAYVPIMQGDMEKLASLDFSPPSLKTIAPPLPTRAVTWKDLLDNWRRNAGGVVQQDGFGVSEDRISVYRRVLKEIQEFLQTIPPDQLTSADARRFVRSLEDRQDISFRTKQTRTICLQTLYKLAVNKGILQDNPFIGLQIKAPAGASDELKYRPFTNAELIKIFSYAKDKCTQHERHLYYILLCTGCRLSEALQLRTSDLKQSTTGVWFFDWKHLPLDPLPVLLKSRAKNNRQTPLHPRLIQEGVLNLKVKEQQRLLGDDNIRKHSTYSAAFGKLLKALDIYEIRKTVLHSFRGTAKDHWRRAGISEDMRLALTGHTSKNIGESSYGEGLGQMPDVMFAKLKEVDLGWLP